MFWTGGITLRNNLILSTYSVDDALLVSTTPTVASASANSATSITTGSFTQSANGVNIASVGSENASSSTIAATGYTVDDNTGSVGASQQRGQIRRARRRRLPLGGSALASPIRNEAEACEAD
jgi:hypothetical protein